MQSTSPDDMKVIETKIAVRFKALETKITDLAKYVDMKFTDMEGKFEALVEDVISIESILTARMAKRFQTSRSRSSRTSSSPLRQNVPTLRKLSTAS